ncbi:DUF333 domain-containing protein [Providencia rettgeri]|jgi:putative hemolysin|uniref:putative hemolysin n=1 Tax=Providencia rettgeri TaxID=587 RepID=UPI001BAD352B|nr:DUF333 domain-containing protein [Providencia rettgeri]MBS0858398.1 DUF333 domain-containing protein [Providencia rettgeri]MBS0872137.1 DUF333 domain-containing protein [Providencia rettgeri]MBS0919283.1 DUF333 domain-containing protein [Providencia rettgeri]HEQ1856710.1 DUF333 domain-containing protein [Providencia alcalifaciens]
MKKIMILSALISLTACSSGKNDNSPAQVGMANPASVYCAKLGGKLDIVNTNDGQVGYCTLPSGEKIEEWSLYRRDHK